MLENNVDPAVEARRIYYRSWKDKNREHVNQYQREWQRNNPDKVKASKQRYWERKAIEYGIVSDSEVNNDVTN